MKKAFIINGHQYYEFSQGKFNATLVEKAAKLLKKKGYEVKTTEVQKGYDVEEEIAKYKWADVVLLQTPINWMGVSWSFKKYMDEVFTAGMMGEMSAGDGRTAKAPKENYGLGGLLKGKYMLSLTCNAPKEAFNNPDEKFFAGISEDDLFLPMHLNFKWFGFEPLPTFVSYDVMKNAEIEKDLTRFETHFEEVFSKI
ncbi:NAD(P)H-dependent oxidoreductase [uncultured Microscilla sp.]|uniref:NAD(P)H-dependent oxidoreductase n=1 Tax=uncultured Microscilla sp. TaxID=432653 RepID=UPI002617E20F|nr:NAD(P)H-dependent oxidoreductase [uncultured Microscilla sp.]